MSETVRDPGSASPVNIVVADQLPASAVERLKRPGWSVVITAGQDAAARDAALSAADALVVRSATKVTAALIEKAPRLRVVARAGTGVDTIDVDAATARGILVINAPGANSVSVAELAMGLALALVRHVPAADASMKGGQWEKSKFTGDELCGRTLGLIGFGRIGREVAQRARAFDMTVLTADPYLTPEAAQSGGAELVTLDELLSRADVISLHAPSTAETRQIINRGTLARMKKGARLINTARGELIDTGALVEALKAGQIGGAAIDVFDVEPPTDPTLQSMPQVIATPHIAASTREGQERVGLDTVDALCEFLERGIVRNAVNAPALSPAVAARIGPLLPAAQRFGQLAAALLPGPLTSVGVRVYGELAALPSRPLADAILTGLFSGILAEGVSPVNVRAIAGQRGVEIVESQSSRAHDHVDVVSLKVWSGTTERWLEAAFPGRDARLVRIDDVRVDAPLAGTLLVIWNADEPGVIGRVGTIAGDAGLNIASFSLGRHQGGAVGVVSLDLGKDDEPKLAGAIEKITALPAVKEVRLVRV
jgi:D-3-phosphoglycerate dehydrogenase